MDTPPKSESGAVRLLLTGRNYTKKRAASLLLVYVLVLAHVIHWRLSGRTMAPLEFNEARLTLEVGIVTAGFLFMAIAFASTAIFGRFFCSWGCHILALEDGCSWLLDKMGLRPKPIRSKLLAWIPIGLVAYLFLWPVARRLAVSIWPGAMSWLGTPPEFAVRVASETESWGSFVTNDLWRNLPGPWIAGLTFGVCGFAVVYLVGTRSFCRYACPYGAVFAFADKFAKGRIVSSGGCVGCGKCTDNCRSDVQVIEEINEYGKVVDPACLKCLDCVSGCPSDALAYGFTTSAHESGHAKAKLEKDRDFSRKEEAVLVCLFALALGIFVGLPEGVAPWAGALYGKLSLFLSVTLAVITALVALHMWRGNLKGAWMAEGGYEPIAEQLFRGLEVDAYFMEYDTQRPDNFGPLHHLPNDKVVVLGLISSKTPELEPKDEIKRRINGAAKLAPLDRLALSPQFGFSSGGGGGQVVTADDTRCKLELVLDVARDVWD